MTCWGDTVNTASRMESRGEITIKGKGKMQTYWLRGKTAAALRDSAVTVPQNAVSIPVQPKGDYGANHVG